MLQKFEFKSYIGNEKEKTKWENHNEMRIGI
jgi:hypothetical protein